MGYFLIFINLIIGNLSTVLRKSYIKQSLNIKTANSIYILLAHPIASVYFFVMAKGQVPLNFITFLFSMLYGLCCMCSVIVSFRAYQETNLVYISVFSGAGSFIIPFFFEMFFWKEGFSFSDIVCVCLRAAAIFIPLFFDKDKKRGLKVCVILFLNSAASGLITKAYAVTPGVLPVTTWFFWTNIVILPMATIAVLKFEGFEQIKKDFAEMKPALYLNVMLNTAMSNVSAIIAIWILKLISATMSSIISSAMGMVMTIMLSTLFYKEDIKKPTYISAALTVVAGILSVL